MWNYTYYGRFCEVKLSAVIEDKMGAPKLHTSLLTFTQAQIHFFC